MQQRQLRLGDILDDYCPRERRITNHAVVAMIGDDVKQTRCTTCDADHEYKHARVPRQRRKDSSQAALYSQVLAGGPKKVPHDPAPEHDEESSTPTDEALPAIPETPETPQQLDAAPSTDALNHDESHDPDADEEENGNVAEGPAHRRLIRATLPRIEGQPPPTRPAPEFTIRQPTNRPGRFRPRHQQQQQRGASPFQGNRSGNFGGGGGGGGNRAPMSRSGKRHHGGSGRKRSK